MSAPAKYTWRVYHPGADPEHDKIVRRRFGRDHKRRCNRPEILTCAMPECQYANKCQAPRQRHPVGPAQHPGASSQGAESSGGKTGGGE